MTSDFGGGLYPNLFIVGAPKCGTTSLYEYLRQHPQIFFPWDDDDYSRVKEPNFFCPELEIRERDAISDPAHYLGLYRAGGKKGVRDNAEERCRGQWCGITTDRSSP